MEITGKVVSVEVQEPRRGQTVDQIHQPDEEEKVLARKGKSIFRNYRNCLQGSAKDEWNEILRSKEDIECSFYQEEPSHRFN